VHGNHPVDVLEKDADTALFECGWKFDWADGCLSPVWASAGRWYTHVECCQLGRSFWDCLCCRHAQRDFGSAYLDCLFCRIDILFRRVKSATDAVRLLPDLPFPDYGITRGIPDRGYFQPLCLF